MSNLARPSTARSAHNSNLIELTREEWEIGRNPLYKSHVIEQALEAAALMLGSERSRGYCLEMICADFLAGANLMDSSDPDVLVLALSSSFQFLSQDQQPAFREFVNGQVQSGPDPARRGILSGAPHADIAS
jgi:hypothetical protein